LGHLLSLQQRNLQSKLAVVSARPVFIGRTVFTVLKNTNKHIKDHPQESYILSCTAWIPVYLYIFLLQFSMRNLWKYKFSEIVDALLIQLALLLSMLCLLYLVINTFRFFLNKPGKISKELNKNSYGVYIIHPIGLGGLALILLDMGIPSLLKHLILTVSTYIACNLIVSFYRKVIKSKTLPKRMEEKL